MLVFHHKNRLSQGTQYQVRCRRALTQGRGGCRATEEEEEEWPLMSGPDWLTEYRVFKYGRLLQTSLWAYRPYLEDLWAFFFKEEELAFPVFDSH